MSGYDAVDRESRALEDRDLVRRIGSGDGDALSDLYNRYSGMLLALTQRILGNLGEAEEVLQEAFVQVWNQAGRYDLQRSSVVTWLVLITRSRALDRLRNRKVGERTLATVKSQRPPTHTSPEGVSDVLSGERRARLAGAMQQLPDEQRQVVELAYYRGFTQREIAAETGIPLGTVKTRTLLALKKLRLELQSEIEELL